MAGELHGVWEKFHHARRHAEAFDAEVAAYLSRRPCTVVVTVDPEPPHTLRCRWQVREAPAALLSLLVGDLCANLRATLDYLAWQLVLAGGGRPDNRTALPCVRRSADWPRTARTRLAGVADPWLARVEALQPYHHAADPDGHPFAVLDRLNNVAKHHGLPVALVAASEWRLDCYLKAGWEVSVDQWLGPAHPVADGAELWRMVVDPPQPQLTLGPVPDPPLRVVFPDAVTAGSGWGLGAGDLVAWVGSVVQSFAPAFAAPPG